MNKAAPLEPDKIYHVYNRANGSEQLFLSSENYQFFLRKVERYISPIANTFCYCLMPNHFHFLIRIKDEKEVEKVFRAFPKFQTLEKLPPFNLLLSKQFSNLFSSYTQAFNKMEGRMGSLFMKNFKRKEVQDEKYLGKLIHYIHLNPVEAGLVNTPDEWTFSSYAAIVSDKPTRLLKKEVIELFNDVENFKYCHHLPPQLSGVEDF